ncbi:MAG: MFS transporter, partial [Armatimonadota bacterium]|nr:MFS transporter [Armatimonadota bacterium]
MRTTAAPAPNTVLPGSSGSGSSKPDSSGATRLGFMLRALSYRNYRLYFIGQGVSMIGTWMMHVAMSWLVYRLTDSPLMLGVIGFAGQIPAFLLAP